jgi:hypothetical protein
MDKIYMVMSHFEDFESTRWQTIGLFTDKNLADETAKKWKEFYEEKIYIFNEPKDWKPSDEDLSNMLNGYGSDEDFSWQESLEYSNRVSKYSDVMDFKEIKVEEFDSNKDISLNNLFTNEYLLSLMTQWDRNYKLEKIIK